MAARILASLGLFGLAASAHWSFDLGSKWLCVNQQLTYDAAVEYCFDQGGFLASATTPGENNYMELQFPKQKIWYGQKCTGSKCDDESKWPEYGKNGWTGNWANGQPNCDTSNCVVCTRTHTSGGGEWNDGNCKEKYRFLCRRFDRWEKVHGYSWMKVDVPTTHAKAVDFCARQGADIATPDDHGQNDYMAKQFPGEKIWYGYKCTGSKCDDPYSWRVQDHGWMGNWAIGQPNCGTSSCEVCARTSTGDEWNDGNCQDEYRFMCKKDYTWHLGEKGASCDAACAAASLTCHLAATQALDINRLKGITDHLNITCPEYLGPQKNYADLPGLEQGKCFPASPSTTCEKAYAGTVRFCACQEPPHTETILP